MRMTDISAAIGLAQLKKLPEYTSKRQHNAKLLTDSLRDIQCIQCPVVHENCEHVFHQYTIRTQDRDALAEHLMNMGIGTGIYYPIPIHIQPYYRELGYKDSLPITENASREVLSLPVHPGVTDEDIATISNAIRDWSGSKC